MRIYLNELSDLETEFDFTEDSSWLKKAVHQVDEQPANVSAFLPRQIKVHFEMRKVDEVVVVNGKIDTFIQLTCSRCANDYRQGCDFQFSSLFCKDPLMAGVGHLVEERDKQSGTGHELSHSKPMGQNQGYARHAHDTSLDSEEGEAKDLDITYLADDYLELADIVTEQLQLKIPFQPLCESECKGICLICGNDRNEMDCQCEKNTSYSPFTVLRDLKI